MHTGGEISRLLVTRHCCYYSNSYFPSHFMVKVLKEKFNNHNAGCLKRPQKEEKKSVPGQVRINYITLPWLSQVPRRIPGKTLRSETY